LVYKQNAGVGMELKRRLGLFTAVCVIVGDMIGTGIFSTTGYALGDMGSATLVLALWVIGGIVAISGALSYAELSSIWPEAGGEYVYLKNTFGKLPAFMTGWVSLFVGFSAAVATSALVLTGYLAEFLKNILGPQAGAVLLFSDPVFQKIIAIAIIVFFAVMHILGVRRGTIMQNILTVIKAMIVLALLAGGLVASGLLNLDRLTAGYDGLAASMLGGLGWLLHPSVQTPGLPQIALTLLIIMFAYSGWNAATYIAGEIRQPAKNLPRALFWSTFGIMLVYVLLNVVYLLAVPTDKLVGQESVGAIAAGALFGEGVASVFSLGIAVILLSAVSAQMFIGPRVTFAMAKDRMLFGKLGTLHPKFETPHLAVILQAIIASVYILLGSAQDLMMYMGFALSVFPLLSIIGLVWLRIKRPELPRPYKVPFYPLFPAIYIVLTIAMMVASLMAWTKTSLWAIVILVISVPVYYFWRAMVKRTSPDVR
jgi:APA family basic amino acid/polyamine antiporter